MTRTTPAQPAPKPAHKKQRKHKQTSAELFAAFERTKPNPRPDLLLAGITEREWF